MYSGSLECPQGTFHWLSNSVSSPLQLLRGLGLSLMYPYSFLSSHGFKIVRKVCISLLHEGRLRTQQEFNKLVFGDLLGRGNFTVVFDEWRAIRNESAQEGKLDSVDHDSDLHRILIKDSPCTDNAINLQPYHTSLIQLPSQNLTSHQINPITDADTASMNKAKLGFIPSDRVLTDTTEFRAKYMNNKPYIAIMMRMEILQRGIASESSYTNCLNTAKNLWEYATQKYGINQTFITSDLGKYGSYSWAHLLVTTNQQLDVSTQFQDDIIKMVGMPSSIAETTNKNFETVTGSTGRVKIAWTQSIFTAEARCIIFLGGGYFQILVLNIHSALYPGRECFAYLDSNCKQ